MKKFILIYLLIIILQLQRIIIEPFDGDTIAIILLCIGQISTLIYIDKREQL